MIARTMQRLVPLLFLVLARLGAMAQPPCPDSIPRTITAEQLDGYTFNMGTANYPNGSFYVFNWQYAMTEVLSNGSMSYITFPDTGTYLVCAMGQFQSDVQSPCTLEACDLVHVNGRAPTCPDLTLMIVAQPTSPYSLYFSGSLSMGTANVSQHIWDLGDGSASTEPAPQHTYEPGAYRVCLTATVEGCSYTACKWLYLGQGSAPCSSLFEPAIEVHALGNTIVAYDRSMTSGLEGTTTWDLGDGTSATGPVVMHTYSEMLLPFAICADIAVSGPMVDGDCTAYLCQDPFGSALSVGPDPAEAARWVRPTLVEQGFTIGPDLPAGTTSWELLDLAGRRWAQGGLAGSATHDVDASYLPAGLYCLRINGASGSFSSRLVKQ